MRGKINIILNRFLSFLQLTIAERLRTSTRSILIRNPIFAAVFKNASSVLRLLILKILLMTLLCHENAKVLLSEQLLPFYGDYSYLSMIIVKYLLKVRLWVHNRITFKWRGFYTTSDLYVRRYAKVPSRRIFFPMKFRIRCTLRIQTR